MLTIIKDKLDIINRRITRNQRRLSKAFDTKSKYSDEIRNLNTTLDTTPAEDTAHRIAKNLLLGYESAYELQNSEIDGIVDKLSRLDAQRIVLEDLLSIGGASDA